MKMLKTVLMTRRDITLPAVLMSKKNRERKRRTKTKWWWGRTRMRVVSGSQMQRCGIMSRRTVGRK